MKSLTSPTRRFLSVTCLTLAACTPSPQEAALSGSVPNSRVKIQNTGELRPAGNSSSLRNDASPDPLTGSPAAAEGRRILSTAFVRVGADGHLTVDLQDGRVMVLRNVTLGPRNYCGVRVRGDHPDDRYCGSYAEVVAARPGGAPVSQQPGEAVSNLAQPKH